MNRSSKQKINKETQILNETLDQMDLTDIFKTFHPNTKECTVFLGACGTLFRIDHILSHKSRLNKFKKTEIISRIFSDHKAIRLGISYKKKTCKKHKHKNMEIKQQVTK